MLTAQCVAQNQSCGRSAHYRFLFKIASHPDPIRHQATTILCHRNAYNRGALSADTLRVMGYRLRDSLPAA
jgi:hypothetical protein